MSEKSKLEERNTTIGEPYKLSTKRTYDKIWDIYSKLIRNVEDMFSFVKEKDRLLLFFSLIWYVIICHYLLDLQLISLINQN